MSIVFWSLIAGFVIGIGALMYALCNIAAIADGVDMEEQDDTHLMNIAATTAATAAVTASVNT